MTKIDETKHVTKDNVIKKNPRKKVVYGGIIDDLGMESFTTDEENKSGFPFQMRAQANRARNAIFYTVKLNQNDADSIKLLLKQQKFQAAADKLVDVGVGGEGNKMTVDDNSVFMKWFELRNFNKREHPDK